MKTIFKLDTLHSKNRQRYMYQLISYIENREEHLFTVCDELEWGYEDGTGVRKLEKLESLEAKQHLHNAILTAIHEILNGKEG
jgi:hypothetical protein